LRLRPVDKPEEHTRCHAAWTPVSTKVDLRRVGIDRSLANP
jgi:hypothetical protein